MTRLEYDLVKFDHPHLHLPHFSVLPEAAKAKLHHLTRDQLIAARTAVLLSRDHIANDPIQPWSYRYDPLRS